MHEPGGDGQGGAGRGAGALGRGRRPGGGPQRFTPAYREPRSKPKLPEGEAAGALDVATAAQNVVKGLSQTATSPSCLLAGRLYGSRAGGPAPSRGSGPPSSGETPAPSARIGKRGRFPGKLVAEPSRDAAAERQVIQKTQLAASANNHLATACPGICPGYQNCA